MSPERVEIRSDGSPVRNTSEVLPLDLGVYARAEISDMMDKDDDVSLIREIRVMLASDKEAKCSCPKTKYEWYGDGYNCIRIHRHFGDHVPNCLQLILKDKMREIARAAEMTAERKPVTPDEYWDHLYRAVPPER